jgi:acyl carrier protein
MLTPQPEFAAGVSESGILTRIRTFVEQNSVYAPQEFLLAEDDRFFEKAAVNSKYVKAMVGFVEDEFGVLLSPAEISEENLGSLRAVARFVASKQPYAVG